MRRRDAALRDAELEGAQAGLSWSTILGKRENYRAAFEHWDPHKIARYGERDVARLMGDAGIVRNGRKIAATIANARAVLELTDDCGGLVPYLWSWVGGRPVIDERPADAPVPSRTELSDTISKDLTARGFRFVGSTIVYAYLQAVGVVDDHARGCFRYRRFKHPPHRDRRAEAA